MFNNEEHGITQLIQSDGMAQLLRRSRSVKFDFTHIKYIILSLALTCSLQTPNVFSQIVTIRQARIENDVTCTYDLIN